MISLATLLGALRDLIPVAVLFAIAIVASKGYLNRAVTWLARKARGEFNSPSPAAKAAATPSHPSVRTPGLPCDGRPLDDYEKRALDAITRKFTWDHEPQRRVPQQKERS